MFNAETVISSGKIKHWHNKYGVDTHTEICDYDSNRNIETISHDNKTVKYEYDAWGNHTVSGSDTALGNLNPFRYRGYYFDTEFGLYYLQSRYYDPDIGRFISADDVSYLNPESIFGLNLYAYCNNNPVMGIDPEGTFSWEGFWNVVAAVAIVAVVTAAVVATAGAATAGIATVVCASAATKALAVATVTGAAFVASYASGMSEVINQVITHGAEEINFNSVAVQTAGKGIDAALTAGSYFTGPAGKSLLAGARICVSGLTNYLYGKSENYTNTEITTNMVVGMIGTAGASLLMFFNNPSKAITASFNIGIMKMAVSIFGFLKNK